MPYLKSVTELKTLLLRAEQLYRRRPLISRYKTTWIAAYVFSRLNGKSEGIAVAVANLDVKRSIENDAETADSTDR